MRRQSGEAAVAARQDGTSCELKVDIYLPLYVRDFLAATFGWSAEERGHYLTLLMIQWDRGALPAELQAIERLSPGVSAVWAMIESKFPTGDDGLRRNRRLEDHRSRAVEVRRKRAEAASRAARARHQMETGEPAVEEQSRGNRTADVEQTQANGSVVAEHPHGNRMREAEQSQSDRRAKTCHPPSPAPAPEGAGSSPGGEETLPQQPRPREVGSTSAFPQPEDRWVPDVPGEWERLREAWNATPGVERFEPLVFARTDLLLPRISDPNWLRMYPEALRRLPGCRFFERPVGLRQFLAEHFVADVLCGTYDHARPPGRGAEVTAGAKPRRGSL